MKTIDIIEEEKNLSPDIHIMDNEEFVEYQVKHNEYMNKKWIEEQKHQEILAEREHVYQINLECARTGTTKEVLQKVKEAIDKISEPYLLNSDVDWYEYNIDDLKFIFRNLKKELGIE